MNASFAPVAAIALLCACGPSVVMTDDSDGGTGDGGDASGSTADDSTGPQSDAEFGEEQRYTLRLNEDVPPPLGLQMNRGEVEELFGEFADEVQLIELDPSTMLQGTIAALRHACGTEWSTDAPDPEYDCSLTALGQSFGEDGQWQLSPEFALIRLLTMTPANVDVSGSSLQPVEETFEFPASPEVFSDVLADALGIARTDPIVSNGALVASLHENLVQSHPAVGGSGALEITLADALADFAPLAERYGASGPHPGFIVDDVYGELFSPAFEMHVVAESNLRIVDGVDASAGKGFATVVDDRVGPSFDDELEFDFSDPERFSIDGVIGDLLIDMRAGLPEDHAFVPSCIDQVQCHGNLPGSPMSSNSVWGLEPWTLEYVVTAAAHRDYADRQFTGDYVNLDIFIGGENPPGWVEYDPGFAVGVDYDDHYIWEAVMEVFQIRLHDTPLGAIPEGGADVAFTLADIPVGLTGAEVTEALRPLLQDQASQLSDLLLGNHSEDDDPVDFYFRRANDGAVYLFFAAAEHRPEGAGYDYVDPGFFSDPDLTDKVSATQIDGVTDQAHEKVALTVAETTLYFADDTGQTYRAQIEMGMDDGEIEVSLAPRID
ncbi:MAG: hypothetical protein AAF799_22930 [Myxococcota bacterium]